MIYHHQMFPKSCNFCENSAYSDSSLSARVRGQQTSRVWVKVAALGLTWGKTGFCISLEIQLVMRCAMSLCKLIQFCVHLSNYERLHLFQLAEVSPTKLVRCNNDHAPSNLTSPCSACLPIWISCLWEFVGIINFTASCHDEKNNPGALSLLYWQ